MKILVWIEDESASIAVIGSGGLVESMDNIRIKSLREGEYYSIDEEFLKSSVEGVKSKYAADSKIEKIIFVDNSSFCIVRSIRVPRFRFKRMAAMASRNKVILENDDIYRKYTFKEKEISNKRSDACMLVTAVMDERIESFDKISKGLNASKILIYSGAQILFSEAERILGNYGGGIFFYDRGFSIFSAVFSDEGVVVERIKRKDVMGELKLVQSKKQAICADAGASAALTAQCGFDLEQLAGKFAVDEYLIGRLSDNASEYFDFNSLRRYKKSLEILGEYRFAIAVIILAVFIMISDKGIGIYSKWQGDKNRRIELKYENRFYEFENTYGLKKGYVEDVENAMEGLNDISEGKVVEYIFSKSMDLVRVNKISIDSSGISIYGKCESYGSVAELIKSLDCEYGFDFGVENISRTEQSIGRGAYSFGLKSRLKSHYQGE